MLLRLLALTTALCCASPLMAASASYNASNDELFITDIGLAGKTERYRNVLLKMRALPVVLQGDARATTFSFDEATGVLHLPNVVFQGQALAGVRIEGARFDIVAVGSSYEPTPLAFPDAAGFGAQATGGRGGRVITVTNLNANGPGSLQAALDEQGPRTVVFAVSGLIDTAIHLTRGDVTIAGQTSPGGITLRQLHTTEEPFCDQQVECAATARKADNWILQHVRLRPDGQHDDGLRMRYTRRAIVDHVSIGGATDEAVEISYAQDITVQNSIIAETVGDHADRGGVLINYSNPSQGYELTRLALHNNVFNRIVGRYPEFSRESVGAGNSVMDVELSNNLYWDMGYFVDINNTNISGSDSGQPIYYQLNFAHNYAVARSAAQPEPMRYGMVHMATPQGAQPRTTTWFMGNQMNLYPDRSDYGLMHCCNDYPDELRSSTPPAYAVAQRHNFPGMGYASATDLPALGVLRAGAFPRDPMDKRLMQAVRQREIALTPRHINPAGDGSALPWANGTQPPAAPQDSDGDGMPDTWERANGLNPQAQDHQGTQLSMPLLGMPGYTNLEVYLHLLSEQRVREGRSQ